MTMAPPKINELKVSVLWNQLKLDNDFFRYFPEQCYNNYPPREYFFAILSTVKSVEYNMFLENVQRSYWEKLAHQQELIEIDPRIMGELSNIHQKEWMMSKQGDKRICLRRRVL